MALRKLKEDIRMLLLRDDFEKAQQDLSRIPPRQAVNPLISFFCSKDERLRWRAIMSMGRVVSRLADKDPESARVVMRRLMWMLNEESGGIGWGVPEALGEIMARHEKLAQEYGCILASYLSEEGSFLEFPMLQRGALWGLGRFAYARPHLTGGISCLLHFFFGCDDASLRGHAVWAAGGLGTAAEVPMLERRIDDSAPIFIFLNGMLTQRTVGALARESLQKILSPVFTENKGCSRSGTGENTSDG